MFAKDVCYHLHFLICTEAIFNEVLHDVSERKRMNGELINNIRYADDTTIIASSSEDLQSLLQRVSIVYEKFGLKLNVSKTKWLFISKNRIPIERFSLNQTPIEYVGKYMCLGTIDSQWDMTTEIRYRIEKVRSSYIEIKYILLTGTFHYHEKSH